MNEINAKNYNIYNNFPLKSAVKKTTKPKYFNDTVSFSNKKEDNSKISAFEGTKLLLTGAKDKVKQIAETIIKHPLETAATFAISSFILSLFPLIGVSTAAAAGALGVSFAVLSAVKTAKNIKNAYHHKKNNENSKLREDLKQIGSSAVDLALSMNKRVLKRNFNALKYQAKYGTIGIRNDLIQNIRAEKGFLEKFYALEDANITVTGEINAYAGIDELQKELKFSNEIKKKYFDLYKIEDPEEFITKSYERLTTDLGYRQGKRNRAPRLVFDYEDFETPSCAEYSQQGNYITFFMQNWPEKFSNKCKLNCLATQKHELSHFQQIVDIERAKDLGGINALQLAIKEKGKPEFIKTLKDCGIGTESEVFKDFMNPENTYYTYAETQKINGRLYTTGESITHTLNKKQREAFSYNIIALAKEQGPILKGTKDFKTAQKYFKNLANYSYLSTSYSEDMTLAQKARYFIQQAKYSMNTVEIDANAKEAVLRPVKTSRKTKRLNLRAMIPVKNEDEKTSA